MHVLVIDIDSLRPDHVGAYGYGRDVTPHIDAFADDAVRFDRAYVSDSPCMPSRAAVLSGRHGANTGVVTHGPRSQTLASPTSRRRWPGKRGAWRTLPEVLYARRWRTVAVASFPRHPAPWFHQGWRELYTPQEPPGRAESFQTVRGEVVADRGVEIVREHDPAEDLCCYLQFWDPHAPYKREGDPVDDADLPPHPTAEVIEAHGEWSAWHAASGQGIEDRSDLARMLGNYDAEIRYVDRQVGRVLDALREAGLYEETLIVLTADHGEEFGEQGVYRDHWSVFEGTQRVPLLVKPPTTAAGADEPVEAAGAARDHLVTNVDLAPTVLDYAGVDAPRGWQGRSLRPLVANGERPGRDHLVVGHGLYTCQRAVRTDRWKFVRTYHAGLWPGVLPDRLLFDLDADPWEQENVAADHPEVVRDLETRLGAWVDRHVGVDGDPLVRIAEAEGPHGYNRVRRRFEGV